MSLIRSAISKKSHGISHSKLLYKTVCIAISLGLAGCYTNSNVSESNQTTTQQVNNQGDDAEFEDPSAPVPLEGLDVLEVRNTYSHEKGVSIFLFDIDQKRYVDALITNDKLPLLKLKKEDIENLEMGERLQIVGDYQQADSRRNITIENIKQIHKLAPDPQKLKCESIENREWRLIGMAQTPACITLYSDAHKPCDSSDQCEGNCVVRDQIEDATCAASNDFFGCGASIEDFRKTGSIMCID